MTDDKTLIIVPKRSGVLIRFVARVSDDFTYEFGLNDCTSRYNMFGPFEPAHGQRLAMWLVDTLPIGHLSAIGAAIERRIKKNVE